MPPISSMEDFRMRRFLRVVFFIFIVGLLIIWISFLFRPTEVDRENVIGYYAEKNNSLDVVCIGGSATFVFWEPLQAWHDYGSLHMIFA